jgi:Fic family protein
MEEAIALGEAERPRVCDYIRAIHRTLMAGEPERVTPASTDENRTGSAAGSTRRSTHVTSHPRREIDGLMGALVAFVNRDDLPGVAQAAIAHG